MKASTRALLGFDDRLFMLIGMPVSALIAPFLMANVLQTKATEHYPTQVCISLGYVMAYWFAGRFVTLQLRKRLPGPKHVLRRLLYQCLFMLALMAVVSAACKPIILAQLQKLHPHPMNHDTFSIILVSIVLSVAILGTYEAVWGVAQWKLTLVEAEQLRRENVQAQLALLKSQVNPHFLFNSLNTLSSLVHDSPDLSVEFIQKLSTTYRYVLEIKDRELIQLSEEMDCVNAYLFLLDIRFGEALRVQIDIPEEAKRLFVVPLSVQLLIENAIKHNVVSRKKPLIIHIHAGEMLRVSNNLQRKESKDASTGTGLANIQNRYKLLVKQEIVVMENAQEFAVSIPLVKLEKYAIAHH